jgi:cytochrome c oxidase subunit III
MSSFAATPAESGPHPWSNDRKVKLGMLFYVLADVAFAIFLLVTYIWERAYNTGGGWFNFKGMRLPDQTVSILLLVLIVLSAVAYFAAYRGILVGNQTVLRAGLAVALLLVIATLVWQIRFIGQQQFSTQDGTFASSWIMLNAYHVYHLAIGVFLGLALTIRAFAGKYSADRHLGLVTVGYFWYWMALLPVLVWLMMQFFPAKL